MLKVFFLVELLIVSLNSYAFELKVQQVTENVYVLMGEIGPRTIENHALNNTLGFIVTKKGVILIGSGASPSGAKLIEQAVRKISSSPIRWVINISSQDHHWLGNHYFYQKNAEIIALQRTVVEQKKYVKSHLNRLKNLSIELAASVFPVYASHLISSDKLILQFDDLEAHLMWLGGGHFVNDTVLWLPQQKIIFAGDLVFNDRLVDIQPFTNILARKTAFEKMINLQPEYVIPGHGYIGDLGKAEKSTGNYIKFLISNVKTALEDWQELDDVVESLANAKKFKHLKFYNDWHRKNIHQTFLQLERVIE